LLIYPDTKGSEKDCKILERAEMVFLNDCVEWSFPADHSEQRNE
jgi:hypothetical protein